MYICATRGLRSHTLARGSSGLTATKRHNVHVKLDDDVHRGLKRVAAARRTTMQGIFEQHAIDLVRATPAGV